MDEIARGVAAQSVAARIASSRWMAMISAVSAESPRYCNGGGFEGDAAAAPGAREVTEAAELAAIAALRMIDDEVTAVPPPPPHRGEQKLIPPARLMLRMLRVPLSPDPKTL